MVALILNLLISLFKSTIKYRGRLDEGRTTAPPPNAKRELVDAMRAISQGEEPGGQIPLDDCSIKWKAA